jgi:GNAT superfamily N-acetyltransferase
MSISPLSGVADGYHDLPEGKMANVVTCLEMRAKPHPRPAAPTPTAIRLTREEHIAIDRYRALFRRVGERFLWFSRMRLSDDEIAAIVHDPREEVYVVHSDEVAGDAGLLELDFRVEGECELSLFGVTHELIGTTAARAMMNFAIERAWSQPIDRFWLHTCSLDHPKAVPFYLRSGFVAYKRQIEIHDDPRSVGWLPPEAAPNVPIVRAR